VSLIYLDHAASAPRRDEVADAMEPFTHGVVGNPSGSHSAARQARRAIDEARERVGDLLGASPGGVIFTGGGTESCHLALNGVVRHAHRERGEVAVVTSAVEHHAVLDGAAQLARDLDGVTARAVAVNRCGIVDGAALRGGLDARVALVSVMAANNETGVIEPLDEVAAAARELAPDAVLHTDAIAAAHWLDLREAARDVDLVSVCAHKIGGPVNAGALVMRRPVALDPVVVGGGQERGRRAGTVDVAAAVGLAVALSLADDERGANVATTAARRDALLAGLCAIDGVHETAPGAPKLPGHAHVTVRDASSEELLFLLDQDGVCASAASSCSSGAASASHVLAAMGVDAGRARGALRFTLGPETTDADVSGAIAAFVRATAALRA
jgi:cysteine desulfurase